MLYVAIYREYRAKVLGRRNLPLRAKKGRVALKGEGGPRHITTNISLTS